MHLSGERRSYAQIQSQGHHGAGVDHLPRDLQVSGIGWKCFGWALRKAWAEARETARIANIPAEQKAARITALNRTIELAAYSESWPQASREISAARAEITLLSNQQ